MWHIHGRNGGNTAEIQEEFKRMREAIYLWEKGEYPYPFAGEFRPNIRAYLHEDGADRPAMLVVRRLRARKPDGG